MQNNDAKKIAEAIRNYLRDCETASFSEEDGEIHFDLAMPGCISSLPFRISIWEDAFTVDALFPLKANPKDKKVMQALPVFMASANHTTRRAHFDLDPKSGKILCQSFVDCQGQLPGKDIIRNSIHFPKLLTWRYAPGLIDVICENLSEDKAILECEPLADKKEMLESLQNPAVMRSLKKKIARGIGSASPERTYLEMLMEDPEFAAQEIEIYRKEKEEKESEEVV